MFQTSQLHPRLQSFRPHPKCLVDIQIRVLKVVKLNGQRRHLYGKLVLCDSRAEYLFQSASICPPLPANFQTVYEEVEIPRDLSIQELRVHCRFLSGKDSSEGREVIPRHNLDGTKIQEMMSGLMFSSSVSRIPCTVLVILSQACIQRSIACCHGPCTSSSGMGGMTNL